MTPAPLLEPDDESPYGDVGFCDACGMLHEPDEECAEQCDDCGGVLDADHRCPDCAAERAEARREALYD